MVWKERQKDYKGAIVPLKTWKAISGQAESPLDLNAYTVLMAGLLLRTKLAFSPSILLLLQERV